MNCANNSDASVKSEKSLCSLNLGVSCGSTPAAGHEILSVSYPKNTIYPVNRPSTAQIGACHLLPLMSQLETDGEPSLVIPLALFRDQFPDYWSASGRTCPAS